MKQIRQIVFDNEITLWWERCELPQGGAYAVSLNGEAQEKTAKTHCQFKNLQPETQYAFSVVIVDEAGNTIEKLGAGTVKTLARKKRLDVTKAPYYAVGNGETVNTVALQRALDDCKADECVYFPKGIYMTGALNVHSDTEIYLDQNAVLQGTGNVDDYLPKRKSRFEGLERECYSSLLNLGELDRNGGYNCKNVVIRGGGTVSGGGEHLCWTTIETERERLKKFLDNNADYVKTCENENTLPGRVRGRLINMSNCQNVVTSGITMQFGPAWNIHMIYSKDITTCGCKIVSKGVWNGDGWDPDSSENCVVFNTEFRTHDDAIAIKSGKNPEGNVINRPTKNVYIFDCYGQNGIAIGSEMSGGVDGVYIWDCDFAFSYNGIKIKTTPKRGGYVRNVHVYDSVFAAIHVLTDVPYNNDGEGAPTLPKIENISMKNVESLGICIEQGERHIVPPITVSGLSEQHPICDVEIKNLSLHNLENGEKPEMEIKNVENLVIENVQYR